MEYDQSSASSQPQEPGYGCVNKELGANERGLEQEHWFWSLVADEGALVCSEEG